MGSAKQLLPFAGKPVVAGILEALADSPVEGIALVTHSTIAESLDLDERWNTFVAINDDQSTEMIDSVRLGMRSWDDRVTIRDSDGILICPADQPGITIADFTNCIDAYSGGCDRIVVATYDNRRGHPIIFPAAFSKFVHSEACADGLRSLPRAHSSNVFTVECLSHAVIRNMNTPEDYDGISRER